MRPTPPEDRQKIIDLYKGGMTRPAIARETGWSEGTVHNIIKAAGVQGAGRATGIRTDPETEARVVEMYRQGASWLEIVAATGRSEHTVSAIIKRNGGSLDRASQITDEQRARMPAMYASGMDAVAIGRALGCHSSSVYTVLREAGMDRRVRGGCENEGYFDRIDTPAKAYWLGFIGADGCVTGFNHGNPRLQVKLARKDRDHLVLLNEALKGREQVRDFEEMSKGKMRDFSALAIGSKHLVEALVSHGITPRKSATLQPWDGPADLMPHYWRGVMDGDGHITINERGVFTGIVGSEFVTQAYAAWVNGNFGTRVNARPSAHQYWTVQVGGTKRVLRLLAVLYDDAPVALARKKALADLAVHGKPFSPTLF